MFWRLVDDFRVVMFDSPGVVRETADFTVAEGSYQAIQGTKPNGLLTIRNDPKCNAPAGSPMFARFNSDRSSQGAVQDAWDTGDAGNFVWMLRGLADFNPDIAEVESAEDATAQVIENKGEVEPHWQDAGECEPE